MNPYQGLRNPKVDPRRLTCKGDLNGSPAHQPYLQYLRHMPRHPQCQTNQLPLILLNLRTLFSLRSLQLHRIKGD